MKTKFRKCCFRLTALLLATVCLVVCGCRTDRHQLRSRGVLPPTRLAAGTRTLPESIAEVQPGEPVSELPQPSREIPGEPALHSADDRAGDLLNPLLADSAGRAFYDLDPQDAKTSAEHEIFPDWSAADEETDVASVPHDSAAPAAELSDTDVIETLRELGGTVRFDNDTLIGIDLSFTRTCDDQLKLLSRFRTVSHLNLNGTDVTDAGLTALSTMRNLKSLKLRGTGISDDGLNTIGELADLQLLDLSRTQVSDSGLVNLQGLHNLRYLLLNETKISDDALPRLKQLTGLEGLSLIRTQISALGQRELREKLKDCLIVFETGEDLSSVEMPTEFRPQTLLRRTQIAVPMRKISAPRFKDFLTTPSELQLAQIIELAESQPDLAIYLSTIYSRDSDWSSAIEVLQSALDVAPWNKDIRYQLAVALAKNGDLTTASEHFERSVGAAAAHYNISVLLYERMLATCQSHLQTSLAIDPGFDVARSWLEDLRKQSEGGTSDASAIIRSAPSLPVIRPRPVL